MSTLKERLEIALREKEGANQASLAAACKISKAAVTGWFSGDSKTMKDSSLLRASEYLGVRPEWLAFGRGRMRHEDDEADRPGNVIPHHPDDALPADSIAIRVSRAKFSAGNGHQVVEFELEEESEPVIYQLAWLRREGLNPNRVRRFRVKGDSMEPFLYPDDSVLVNLAENDITKVLAGKVYALRYDDDLRIKRLYRHLDGTLVLHSDNQRYKDEIVPPELVEQYITLVGRVRDKSGKGGL